MDNLGKIIVATCFEKLSKVQKIAQSGHTDGKLGGSRNCNSQNLKFVECFLCNSLNLFFWSGFEFKWDWIEEANASGIKFK